MGLEEVRRKVSEITGNNLTVRKLWYSLKYDRGMLMELEGDGDVRMGITSMGICMWAKVMGQKGAHKRQRGPVMMASFVEEAIGGRDDMVEEGRKGAGVNRAAVSESDGCINDHPQNRLRVGREIIEMSDDDEISVASEDVGEDEAAAEEGEENSKGKGLGKKMDKNKQDMIKWKNGVEERIEQKLADTYQKMGCIAAVECYSLMLGEYSVELTNSRKTYTCRVWQTRGIPCCHALAMIAKAKLWVHNYVHPIYKTVN
ncbi:hypothetical protein Cgig2_001653 [Carnegiea gigantea]|uniref:SWIM-type domain-containing protein n=1 Tax=Carnegiea gigantea TaxID=171969 RepID=A0A9Q1Q4V1_9CARY|nr:hypothetical protein Cgig2_001653 [Carnegiea gigantea]